ncbi:MAG TPA: 7-cyano-7-deazaguanine synthase [Gemmatimonadaceae bacterium]|nr:7-cyano-7-deazaguanine synthase [Gemmatimonadaceae bacterium]
MSATSAGSALSPVRTAVLFSAGLDSAVLLAGAAVDAGPAQPIYVSTGLAWEAEERACASRLVDALAGRHAIRPLVTLAVDMRDVYPAAHWAVRGEAPGFDTPDSAVYLEGRNVTLLSKAAVYMAREKLARILIGPLAGNPFPDAGRPFFDAMEHALSIGLASPISIEAPFSGMHKADVIRLGVSLGVPFELTLSCMQPAAGRHCGRCSKCRERRDAFTDARVSDPTAYAAQPPR